MFRRITLGAVMCCILAGCQSERFSSISLGKVAYTQAYTKARQTFRDYYSIKEASPESGKIVGRPRPVNGRPELLLSNPPTRELAEMRLRNEAGIIWADMQVAVQRQDSHGYATWMSLEGRHDRPDQTPAELDAPFTPEQEDIWQTRHMNREMERRILNDLFRRIHGRNAMAESP